MTCHEARIIHVSIDRDWREVYAYMADPMNMPHWASGLSDTMRPEGEVYIADGGPIGKITVRFAPRNDFGVVDHRVTLESGVSVDNALRVVPNGSGAEVMFTLLKIPGMDDEAFERDAAHVLKDLKTLKGILESDSKDEG